MAPTGPSDRWGQLASDGAVRKLPVTASSVVPAIGDTIDSRMGLSYRVVGRQFILDSVLTVTIEVEQLKD